MINSNMKDIEVSVMRATKPRMHQNRKEMNSFLKLINNRSDKKYEVILEIGAFWGGTTEVFANFCRKMISVDIDLPRFYDYTITGCDEYKYIQGSSYEQGTIRKVKKELDKNKIDVLFIDGDHSYEAVKKDFNAYLPLVKKGGIIGFHDIINPSTWRVKGKVVGTSKFWKEIKDKYKSTRFVYEKHKWGIGVLFI